MPPPTISPEINGIRYVIKNRTDVIQQCLLNKRQWNADLVEILKWYIAKNSLSHFLNVGSHIGSVSLPISMCISKVTCIEAYPETYQHLCENIKLNGRSNIDAHNFAVGNSDETVYFIGKNMTCPVEHIDRIANNSGGMHVFTERDIQQNIRSAVLSDRKITSRVQRLDTVAEIDNFDIMLVDIEGYEYEFLLGASAKLLKNKPIIVIEIWNNAKRRQEKMEQTQEQVIDYITTVLHYRLVRRIEDDHIFEPVSILPT